MSAIYDPQLREEYERMHTPRVGERVLYVTPVLSIRSAVVVEPPNGLLADLTVFTAGNKDDDWLDLHEGSKRDIRSQARLVVRRGNVRYDEYGQEPNTWHCSGDPQHAQERDRFNAEMLEQTGNPGSR